MDLLDEEGVGAELEGLGAMGLEPERTPDPTHGGLAHVEFLGQQARGPVRRLARLGLQRASNDLGNLLIGHRAWTARAGHVTEASKPLCCEALAPLPHGRAGDLEPIDDLEVRPALRREQDDLSS